LVPYAEKLENALQLLESVTGHLLDVAAKGKPDRFLADATVYLDLFATIAIAWQWLLQAKVAKNALMEASIGSDINFYQGKIYACRYFFGYELPKIESLAKILKENDGLTVEMKTDCFFDC
jgi:butyryl-CoA dehydrogenase